jgi:hypothetical protein
MIGRRRFNTSGVRQSVYDLHCSDFAAVRSLLTRGICKWVFWHQIRLPSYWRRILKACPVLAALNPVRGDYLAADRCKPYTLRNDICDVFETVLGLYRPSDSLAAWGLAEIEVPHSDTSEWNVVVMYVRFVSAYKGDIDLSLDGVVYWFQDEKLDFRVHTSEALCLINRALFRLVANDWRTVAKAVDHPEYFDGLGHVSSPS